MHSPTLFALFSDRSAIPIHDHQERVSLDPLEMLPVYAPANDSTSGRDFTGLDDFGSLSAGCWLLVAGCWLLAQKLSRFVLPLS